MDALARIEPVARPLLATVDAALAGLGAPAEHSIWALLRQVGSTPGDAVTFVAATMPGELREAGAGLRRVADEYRAVAVPPALSWRGRAGGEYAGQAVAFATHLRAEMADGVEQTVAYLHEVADWLDRSRREVAAALADVLRSAEAVALTRARGLVPAGGSVSRTTVLAAADAGAHVLATVARAIEEGVDLRRAWAGAAEERFFRAPAPVGPALPETIIDVRR